MKKGIALLFIGTALTLAACESKPKTTEAAVNATAADSAATATVDSAAAATSAAMPADSVK